MKPYLLFAGDDYYPCGGWQDYKGDFNSESEAMEYLANAHCGWWHIVHGGYIYKSGRKKNNA
jgi:hypothetical protein